MGKHSSIQISCTMVLAGPLPEHPVSHTLSTHASPGTPRPGQPCPEPTCRGSERRLLPSQTASDTHRRIRGSDKISPVSVSLSSYSVTAKNAAAGSGLCLQCLNKRSISSFSHLPFAIQAPLCCVPWGAGLPRLPYLRVDLQACRTPGRALLSPSPAGLSQNTHELLGRVFSLWSVSCSLIAGFSLLSFQSRPPAGRRGTSPSAGAEN